MTETADEQTPPPVVVEHYAFVTDAALVADAAEALLVFAETDDVAVLERMLGDWNFRRAQQKRAARVVPTDELWSRMASALRLDAITGLGARREVNRDDFETLVRAVDRLARVRTLAGPEFLIADVLALQRTLVGALDDRTEVTRAPDPRLDRIERRNDRPVPDLAAFALAVAECTAGAFPHNIGLGATLTNSLPPGVIAQLDKLRALDDFWAIHAQRQFETERWACVERADGDLWLSARTRLSASVFEIRDATAGGCGAWRRKVGWALPLGNYGGPMTMGRPASASLASWYPKTLNPAECVVSFVIARTAESPPFLAE